VIRKFIPDFVVSDQDLADLDELGRIFVPSIRWLSPYHVFSAHAAKRRLVGRLKNNGEFFHHFFAADGLNSSIFSKIPTPEFTAKIEAAGEAPFNIFRVFEDTAPNEPLRVAKVETTLDGLLPHPLPKGGLVMFKLQHAEMRDHRFLGCVAQRILTELVSNVLELYFPQLKTTIPHHETPLLPELYQALYSA